VRAEVPGRHGRAGGLDPLLLHHASLRTRYERWVTPTPSTTEIGPSTWTGLTPEEPGTAAEDHRHQVDGDLVQQARVEALTRHLTAVDTDVPVPGDLLSGLDGLLDAAGDEHEVLVRGRPSVVQHSELNYFTGANPDATATPLPPGPPPAPWCPRQLVNGRRRRL
jgi:hypothetical protein